MQYLELIFPLFKLYNLVFGDECLLSMRATTIAVRAHSLMIAFVPGSQVTVQEQLSSCLDLFDRQRRTICVHSAYKKCFMRVKVLLLFLQTEGRRRNNRLLILLFVMTRNVTFCLTSEPVSNLTTVADCEIIKT